MEAFDDYGQPLCAHPVVEGHHSRTHAHLQVGGAALVAPCVRPGFRNVVD